MSGSKLLFQDMNNLGSEDVGATGASSWSFQSHAVTVSTAAAESRGKDWTLFEAGYFKEPS